ncbi:MAG: thioredoxin domain-containing protein [Patescibacteria group bacterium]|jgi:protein-disulfide isomerase|nr:thioredoxin domain-containing protein [Patescibacteria group bacterium]
MQKNEKVAFTMGLSVGVALISLVGVIVIGGLYVKSNGLSVAVDKKVENKEIAVKQNENVAVAKDTNTKTSLNSAKELNIAGEKVNGVWTRGDKDAPVTIVEFSDYQCPYCSRHHETMKQVMEAYPGKVKWEYKHFPLDSMHPYARIVAEGAECAGDQDKFWEYTDLLYANQKSINSEIVPQLATQLSLDMDDFTTCISSGKYKEKVASDLAEGQAKGVRGTPGNFVNDVELKGAVPFEQMKAAIDKELNK